MINDTERGSAPDKYHPYIQTSYIYIYIQHGESITNRQNCLLLKQTIEGEGQNTVNTYKYHIHTNRQNCLLLKQTIEGEGQNTVNQLHG